MNNFWVFVPKTKTAENTPADTNHAFYQVSLPKVKFPGISENFMLMKKYFVERGFINGSVFFYFQVFSPPPSVSTLPSAMP